MQKVMRQFAMVLLTGSALAMPACGRSHAANRTYGTSASAPAPATAAAPADTTPYKHHSIIAGAAAGAVAGHYAGHHAVVGAITGAVVQHERNKHHTR